MDSSQAQSDLSRSFIFKKIEHISPAFKKIELRGISLLYNQKLSNSFSIHIDFYHFPIYFYYIQSEFDYFPREFDYIPREFDYIPREFDHVPREFDYIPREFDYVPREFDYIPREFDHVPRVGKYPVKCINTRFN